MSNKIEFPFYATPQNLKGRGLKASDKLIFAILLNYQGSNGYCWPGMRRLANDAELSLPTVSGCIQRLELAKLLTVQHRENGKSNHYIITESVKETLTVKDEDVNKSVKETCTVKDESVKETCTVSENKSVKETLGGVQATCTLALKKLVQNKKRLNDKNQKARPQNPNGFRLASLFYKLMQDRKPSFPEPNLSNWEKGMGKILQDDGGRTPEAVEKVLRFAMADDVPGGNNWSGWRDVIKSPASLDRNYKEIEKQMNERIVKEYSNGFTKNIRDIKNCPVVAAVR